MAIRRKPTNRRQEPEAPSFGGRVREERKAAGLSQKALARMVGIKQPSLSDIESGKTKNPDLHTKIALARELNSNLGEPELDEYLLKRSENDSRVPEEGIIAVAFSRPSEPITLERFVMELQALGVEDFNPAKGMNALTPTDMEEILAVLRSTAKTMVEQKIKAKKK